MKKVFFLITSLFFITSLSSCREKKSIENVSTTPNSTSTSVNIDIPSLNQREQAIKLAQELYTKKKTEDMNFENGPCLSEELMPDWVADIAHDPREDIDNLPENQCSSFREGKTHHFVELDENGKIIRLM